MSPKLHAALGKLAKQLHFDGGTASAAEREQAVHLRRLGMGECDHAACEEQHCCVTKDGVGES
jgi:hypothetical protein